MQSKWKQTIMLPTSILLLLIIPGWTLGMVAVNAITGILLFASTIYFMVHGIEKRREGHYYEGNQCFLWAAVTAVLYLLFAYAGMVSYGS